MVPYMEYSGMGSILINDRTLNKEAKTHLTSSYHEPEITNQSL